MWLSNKTGRCSRPHNQLICLDVRRSTVPTHTAPLGRLPRGNPRGKSPLQPGRAYDQWRNDCWVAKACWLEIYVVSSTLPADIITAICGPIMPNLLPNLFSSLLIPHGTTTASLLLLLLLPPLVVTFRVFPQSSVVLLSMNQRNRAVNRGRTRCWELRPINPVM